MFKFETEVKLLGDAPPAEIAARLAELVAAPRSFNGTKRQKPLRGRIFAEGGSLRWPLNEHRVAARTLWFRLIGAPEGTVLTGKFRVFLPLRIAILLWLGLQVLYFIPQATLDLRRLGVHAIGPAIGAALVGFCGPCAYLWVVVRLGRKRDRYLVKILKNTLASADAAVVVKEILSSTDVAFIDPMAG